MLELSDDKSGALLHIRAFTGEKLVMALIPRARNERGWPLFLPRLLHAFESR